MIIYPSPNDVRVYLDGYWLKSVYRLEFRTNREAAPIVNYRSSKVSDFALGPSVVSGTIVLNFLHPSYFPIAALRKTAKKSDSLYQKARELIATGSPKAWEAAAQLMMRADSLVEEVAAPTELDLLPAFDAGNFNLAIKYADNDWYRLIRGVRLVGEAEVLSASPAPGGDASSSGSPILEQYSYVAEAVETRKWSRELPAESARESHGL